MSVLSALGITPAAEAWAVPSRRLLGLFSGPDVVYFDEAQARRKAGRGGMIRPLVIGQDDGEDDDEQEQGFGRQTTFGGIVWAEGFGARGPFG